MSARAIRSKCSELGIALRPPRINGTVRLLLRDDVAALLKAAAKARGVTIQRIAFLILSAAALDGLIDAVVDDLSWQRRASAKRKLQFEARPESAC